MTQNMSLDQRVEMLEAAIKLYVYNMRVNDGGSNSSLDSMEYEVNSLNQEKMSKEEKLRRLQLAWRSFKERKV